MRSYVRWKVRADPAYDAVLRQVRGRDEPLLDLGCGIGLLAFYLREHGVQTPIIGIDFDQRKVDVARRAATRYRDIDFIAGDARSALPERHNVVMLDLLHYLDAQSRARILANVARAVPAGGIVVIRQGVRDASWRYRFTSVVDAVGRAIRWMKAEHLLYPTREEITAAFADFDAEITPLWGRTPYNNYLFVFRRAASSGITNA
jgi:SAM-dependent methyltransferase